MDKLLSLTHPPTPSLKLREGDKSTCKLQKLFDGVGCNFVEAHDERTLYRRAKEYGIED